LFFLNITIPENKLIKKIIETDLKIYNFLSNQTEVIKVIFDPNSEKISGPKETSSSFSILDFIIIVICFLLVILVLNHFANFSGTMA